MKSAKLSHQGVIKVRSKMHHLILIFSATLAVFIESYFYSKPVFGIFFDLLFWLTISGIYISYFLNKGNKSFRKYFLHTIYIMVSLFAVLFELQNPDSGVSHIITFLILFISGSVFLNVFKQTLFLVSIMLLRFGLSGFFTPMDPYFHYSIIVIAIISLVLGFFLMNFNKAIKTTNALFLESNQILIELDKTCTPIFTKAGFLAHLGFGEEEVMTVIEKHITKKGNDLKSLVETVIRTGKSLTISLTLNKNLQQVPLTLEVMPITGHNSIRKAVIIGYPNLSAESATESKNDYRSELQLPFLINCLGKDLAREGLTLKTQLINEFKFQDLKIQCGGLITSLHDFFLSEKKFINDNLIIDNKTIFNEFVISLEFSWQREVQMTGIPSDIFTVVDDLGGKCFYNSDQNKKSRLTICLSNPQSIPDSKFSVKNLHSITDLVFVNEIINAMEGFLISLDFSVENLSRELGTSRMQLHRKVKGSFGMSPGSLFQYLRMKKAEFLLKSGYSRISDVAYSLGYCDQSHFSKAFRAWFGYPPVEYMRKNVA